MLFWPSEAYPWLPTKSDTGGPISLPLSLALPRLPSAPHHGAGAGACARVQYYCAYTGAVVRVFSDAECHPDGCTCKGGVPMLRLCLFFLCLNGPGLTCVRSLLARKPEKDGLLQACTVQYCARYSTARYSTVQGTILCKV